MSSHHDVPAQGPGNPGRRRFIGGALMGAVAVNLGLSFQQPLAAAEAVVASTAPAPFVQLSQTLCGKGALQPGLALRLYRAMRAQQPALDDQLKQLADFMAQGHPLSGLQAALDQANSPVAALPRALVSAWYTGVVGEGEQAQCVAYEEALMNVTVADQLKPPSYAYGNYASWARQPGAV